MNIGANTLLSGFQAYGLRSAQSVRGVRPGAQGEPVQPTDPAVRPAVDDDASISDAARQALAADQRANAAPAEQADSAAGDEELSPEQREQVRELQARDREVRAHEQAHKAVAGDLAAGGPSYTYQSGPDGRRYAIGGEVQIQLRPGRTPEETVRNMERARRAALAPAEPSGPDRAVAAKASQLAARARAEQQATGAANDDAVEDQRSPPAAAAKQPESRDAERPRRAIDLLA